MRASAATAKPSVLGPEVYEPEKGLTVGKMYSKALQSLMDGLENSGDSAWDEIVVQDDRYSTREFLELNGWSGGMIEMFGLLANQESVMNSAFLELFCEDSGNYYTKMVEIQGGTDRLPRAFLPELKENIRFGARLIAMDQSPNDVTSYYQTKAGKFKETGDYAVITLPFPVLRHVEVLPPFTRSKQRAIRPLHYDASAKILFQWKRRFWEADDGIFGGGPLTDLPIHNVYSSNHGRETGCGIILARYTWSEDAQHPVSLKPDDRIMQALDDVAEIHPQITKEFEVGTSWMWHDDEMAGGAFAIFDPGQQRRLHTEIVKPDGCIHFAGEHTSLHHAWIQRAFESG